MIKLQKPIFLFTIIFSLKIHSLQVNEFSGINTPTFEYLKTKEVPYELKKELDKIFYLPEVMATLSKIYNRLDCYDQFEKMIRNGFEIISNFRIFKHKNFPNLIFKIGYNQGFLYSEKLNASRIRYAQIINENGDNIVKAPKKYAYMPYIFKSEGLELPVSCQSLPVCIVIAEFINKKTLINFKKSVAELPRRIIEKLEDLNYSDLHSGNIIECEDCYMVIDTEHSFYWEDEDNQ